VTEADAAGEAPEDGAESESEEGRSDYVRDGIKQGLGMLSALKDAIEETLSEARERGDLSAERAKELMKRGIGRAQEAAGEAKERLDLVPQREFDALAAEVAELRERLDRLDGGGSGGPTGSGN